MSDELPPSLFNILREDLRALGQRMDHLVTSDTFSNERQRVDGKFADQGREIGTERAERKADIARIQNDIDAAADVARTAREAQEQRHFTRREGLQVALVTVGASGVVSLIVLIVQNVAHLK